ncbi:ImmA/IrrE family metallo-endopeptidase [Gorillibacterium sp. sgz500922]|uniref:ImmA/IrrE family metallo-endopeptidase n=1 Tax=Gorillibacterium sp. sgz500922 TaxID=3446694 RepID=UPI003F66BCD6
MDMDQTIRRLIRKHKSNCPFEIASGQNIEVWFEDLGACTRGMYRKTLRRKYIVIHRDLSEEWQRVICAHELGHAILHPGVSRFWIDEHTYFFVGKYERQANQFAVRLLTSQDSLLPGEGLPEMLRRNCIPEELHSFY